MMWRHNGESLKLGGVRFQVDSDFSGYLESWTQELKARQNRVRLLIGDAHWLSDGHHKEAILREFLARYLSNTLIISRGFVRPPQIANRCSPELDIIIADPSRHPPLFLEGGVAIVPPSAVLAFFEVKTTLTRTTLRDALRAGSKARLAIMSSADWSAIFNCICFFDAAASLTAQAAANILAEELADTTSIDADGDGRLRYHPTCVCVANRFVAFIGSSPDSKRRLRLFEAGELSLACAFADMFAAISDRSRGPNVGELEQIIESFEIRAPIVLTIGDGNRNA
jgi:hypothetical protein